MIAMSSSGRKSVTSENPSPVADITTAAASNKLRYWKRRAFMPTASVITPDPNSVQVAIAPTCSGPNPRVMRYAGSRRLTKPSPNARRPRTNNTLRATGDIIADVAGRS